MADETKTQERPQTLQERLYEKGVKTIEKRVGESVERDLEAGRTPQQTLSSLLQSVGVNIPSEQDVMNHIKQIQQNNIVPIPKSRKGIFALGDLIKGKGFNPDMPREGQMSFDDAKEILNLQLKMGEQGLSSQKVATDIIKNLVDIAQSTGNKELFEQTGGQANQEIDWRTGQLTLESKVAEKEALIKVEQETKATTEKKVQANKLAKDLENYFAIGDLLPTEEGIARYRKGFELFGKRIGQSDIIGAAAADLDALNKRLRVRIVKYNGDVGNINIVEQKAAEKVLYFLNDSTKLRALKKAYLIDLTAATMSGDGGAVRQLIDKFVNEPEFQVKYPDIYKTYQEQHGKKLTGDKAQKGSNQQVKSFKNLWE